MVQAYKTIKVGDPLDPSTLVGPLHTRQAVQNFVDGVDQAKQ